MKPFPVCARTTTSRYQNGEPVNCMMCRVRDVYGDVYELYAEIEIPRRYFTVDPLGNLVARSERVEYYGFGKLKRAITAQADEMGIGRGNLLFLSPVVENQFDN